MFYKKYKIATASVALVGLLAACGVDTDTNEGESGEADELEFTLTHITQTSHGWHETAEKFNEELQELSDGRMSVNIYPAGAIGDEQDMLQQMETGEIDFGFITNAYMSSRVESFNAWFMPFVFDDLEEAVAARDIEPAQDMLKELSDQGFIGMDFLFAGNRHILTTEKEVSTPEDLAGEQIRITGGPAIQSFWEEIGAGPIAMPLPEVYTSLQTGVIDGIDIDLDALITENLYETADHLALSNHMTWPAVVMMSELSHDALSAEDQEIVKEAMKNAIDWGVEDAITREESNLEEAEEVGLIIKEFDDIDAFNEVRDTIHERFSAESDIIADFLEITGK
ncbi:TRAP transporter substrate-binding protein DctP [Salipaludibacillus sp. CF4.18]|uniref:TRAP transporter substrate-binding protein n=1 Tax=Salipaludibacillus sp. CF4.18 TaxID=3373081 RepID=UPI003EE5BC81